MKDFIIKLWILIVIIFRSIDQGIDEWKIEVWRKSLDDKFCCDDCECGCQSISVKDNYLYKHHKHDEHIDLPF